MATPISPRLAGIPIVRNSAERDTLYPTPDTNQRAHNLATGTLQRWNGSSWTDDFYAGALSTGAPAILDEDVVVVAVPQQINFKGSGVTVTADGVQAVVTVPGASGAVGTLAQVLAEGNDADGLIIANVLDPVADQDAATKAYVDSVVPNLTPVSNGSSGAAKTLDFTERENHNVTMTADCTFTFTAPPDGDTVLVAFLQDGTGDWVPTWPAAVNWGSGGEPAWVLTAGLLNVAVFYFDGATYWGAAFVIGATP